MSPPSAALFTANHPAEGAGSAVLHHPSPEFYQEVAEKGLTNKNVL